MNGTARLKPRSTSTAWLLMLAYAALITALSSLSRPPLPHPLRTTPGTFALHALEFAGFALLLFRALDRSRPRWSAGRLVLVTIAVTAAFGGLDEVHQKFVEGRVSQTIDLAADTLGGTVAALLMAALRRENRRSGR